MYNNYTLAINDNVYHLYTWYQNVAIKAVHDMNNYSYYIII